MKQNIWTIKNILRIIISILVITSMIKSCSMAATGTKLTYIGINATDDEIYDALVEHFNLNTTSPIDNNAITYEQYKTNWSNHNGIKLFLSENNYNSGMRAWFNYGTNTINGNTDPSGFKSNGITINGKHQLYNMYTSGTNKKYYYTGGNSNDGINGTQGYMLVKDQYGQWFEYTAVNWSITDYQFKEPFKFTFFDETISAIAPNGETAYCVFLNDLTDIQGIGYIEDYENHPNTQITIFMQNYRDADNVKVEALQPTDYQIVNGELWVKTITMWSPMVYEIVGIDNGPSGDFLNGQNFTAYYYIATASNPSGDPNFYGTPPGYDDNQFFLWKLLGNFGNDSGDPGSGLFGGIQNLFGGIYDKMFKVESGDILHALEHIKETNNITDMDLYSGDLEILGILTGEPNDFVISWNNIEYQDETIIPSGDINFSKRIRDNQTLQQVMNWVHVILGFSLITIIIQEYWFTFLKILGVGVSVYEDNQEERDRLEEVYGTHVYDTMVTTQERDGTERIRKRYTTYRKRRR